jgi:Domain of unknown function (DUF4333)
MHPDHSPIEEDQMATKRRSIAVAAAALVLTAGVTGCGKSVDSGDVEKELSDALKKTSTSAKVGEPSCQDDLEAEVGKTTDCEVEFNGKKQKFKAKVTAVDGDKVKFTFQPV